MDVAVVGGSRLCADSYPAVLVHHWLIQFRDNRSQVIFKNLDRFWVAVPFFSSMTGYSSARL